MITVDAQRRESVLNDILAILDTQAAETDRALLAAFAPIAYREMPDSMALTLPASALARRIHGYFTFVARTMPPDHQLYRGLPGIHVSVRNPSEAETDATGSTHGGHYEVTIVETHTPDAPFLFESLKHYLQKQGIRILSAVHPIFSVHRQWEQIVSIDDPHADGSRELLCQFRIERVESPERLRRMEHQIYSLLKSVFLAVEDFDAMRRSLREFKGRLRDRRGSWPAAAGAQAFLDWLLDDNYVFMGVLKFIRTPDGFEADHDSALGAFREPDLLPVVFPGLLEEERHHVDVAADDGRVIDIDYRNRAGAIHHLEPVDDMVIREWSPEGELASAALVLGRLAKGAFTAKADSMPLLAQKLEGLLAESGVMVNSHHYREIRAIFNHFPKRELFYCDGPSLRDIIERMAFMSSDDEVVVSLRQTPTYSALRIAFSELRYSNKAEQVLCDALAAAFGPVAFHTWADCGAAALLIFYFTNASLEREIDVARVHALTSEVISTWEDQVAAALEQEYGTSEGRRLFKRYVRQESRSGLYRELTKAAEVPDDVRWFEVLEGRLELGVKPDTAETLTLKLFSPKPMGLTETLRTLQNLGLSVRDEVNIPLVLPDGRRGWLQRLGVSADAAIVHAIHHEPERLRDALRAIQEERATDDPLNALVLTERLAWRDVEVLRTLRNHLLQIRPTYNVDTLSGVLLRNHRVAGALFRAFDARFNPGLPDDRSDAMARADEGLRAAFRAVGSLFDDELLRGMENLIAAAVRTNFYQRPERPVVAIKVECAKVQAMVVPRPLFEIYVHSPQLEGIHLRGGRVARGGIRWSDRHDDFRTEILGLMKTQMVKNAIIVPVGSKGGFVLKGNVPPRPALDGYLVDRYRQFVSALLDVTDNLVNGQVAHPPEVVRHDGPDPYLVVAADKGTAHLSDTANRVSAQYGFWLGDAFASGGSNGYDHKREGITARGAWECVRHHFRNLGVDVQAEPFSMAGIGDMSGDVFGNGALRSRTTRLVAAFNHIHIFLDPSPDPERSFIERERLFGLPRSTWRDYDATLISEGGGVFDRSAKAIPLAPAARLLLDLDQEAASGEEIVRAILKARVDLLYNGGIGTYVKAEGEDDALVGDRANDRVRVSGADLRARVVAEGGNLGFTQRGRLEYWARGGSLNTDAVDNSGGVDMSDHEVNIKILLDQLVRSGTIGSRDERNRLLADMTDDVSDLVLADNANQAVALTLDGLRSAQGHADFIALINDLLAGGVLHRYEDAVPQRDELMATAASGRGLPRPLLCVMLGHVKNWAFTALLNSHVPDSEVAQPFLTAYFPSLMRERFAALLGSHPLKREIIATAVANYVINHEGVSFLHRNMAMTGRPASDIVHAYLLADRGSRAQEHREAARTSMTRAGDEFAALLQISEALERATLRLLQNDQVDLATALDGVQGVA
ncbi:MAG: NAD-glutamate dehydrogenase domain-containing protein [Vicinamibacterales bacterium]